jgi:hypothetical protein
MQTSTVAKIGRCVAVLCGNPTHYSATAYTLFSAIFRVSGLVQVDAEVFGWKNVCQLYRQV